MVCKLPQKATFGIKNKKMSCYVHIEVESFIIKIKHFIVIILLPILLITF